MKCLVLNAESVFRVMHIRKYTYEKADKINTLINKYLPRIYSNHIPDIIHHKTFLKLLQDKELLRDFYLELLPITK